MDMWLKTKLMSSFCRVSLKDSVVTLPAMTRCSQLLFTPSCIIFAECDELLPHLCYSFNFVVILWMTVFNINLHCASCEVTYLCTVHTELHWIYFFYGLFCMHGTACHRLSGMHRRWRLFIASWRLHFFCRRLTMTRQSWLYCTV